VPLSDLLPAWQGAKSVTLLFLCLAMLCFPFSVAATNIALGIVLGVGLLSGIWWQGLMALWQAHRGLMLALIVYLALAVIGLIWSLDQVWGLKILGRHWFWLLLPVIAIVVSAPKCRNLFLGAMSVGLTANLMFCVLQANGLVDGHAAAGSSAENATGHIGHTSFGFIYGIWAAWLMHLGLMIRNRYSWLLWSLSLWSVVMVFMAQGKSGYIVTAVSMLFVAVKWLQENGNRVMYLSFAGLMVLLVLVVSFGPGKERILGSWQAVTGDVQSGLNHVRTEGDLNQYLATSSATARLEWWKLSYQMWLERPVLGVGTGGFPAAAAEWQQQHSDGRQYHVALVHPHNQYLLVMVRWGIIGLISLLALLYLWIRVGIALPWEGSVALPLVALSGTALLLHGLSSASLEEHFSTFFAVIVAASGLSERFIHKG